MKTNNEEKHEHKSDGESKSKFVSSNKNNDQQRKILHSASSRGNQDAGQERQQQSSYDNRNEQNKKRRPRVGDRAYSTDSRNTNDPMTKTAIIK